MNNINIQFNNTNSLFGPCFIALYNNSIIYLTFIVDGYDKTYHLTYLKKNITKIIFFEKINLNVSYSQNKSISSDIISNVFSKNNNTSYYLNYKNFTLFKKQVIQELIKIPFGSTISYQDLANKIKKPKAVRAVANCIASNSIAFLIPCHRVIGKNGRLTGYKWGVEIKQKIINWEKSK